AASPDDFVVVFDCWTADSMTEPLVASAAPEPSCAVVVLVMSDRASEGVIEMPPAEPALAVAELAYVPVAANETSPAPDSPLPFSNAADVRLATMFIATDAPTPTLPPLAPAPEGSASADTVVLLSATRETSPFPLRWMEAFGPINADAWVSIKL